MHTISRSIALALLPTLLLAAPYLCRNNNSTYQTQAHCNTTCGSTCEELDPLSSGTSSSCDTANFEGFVYSNNVTYAITKSTLFWADTVNLALPKDEQINTILKGIASYYGGNAWIGVYDPLKSSNYNSVDSSRFKLSNGITLTYSNWSSGQPDNKLDNADIGVTAINGEHWVYIQSNATWLDDGYHSIYGGDNKPKRKALAEWNGPLDCVNGTPKSTTSNTNGYYCGDGTGNVVQCTTSTTDACTAPAVWNSTTQKCENTINTLVQAEKIWDCFGYVDAGTTDTCNGKGWTYHVKPGEESFTGAGHPHAPGLDCGKTANINVCPSGNECDPPLADDKTYDTGYGNKFRFKAECVAEFDAYVDENGNRIEILPGTEAPWGGFYAFYPIRNLSTYTYKCTDGSAPDANNQCQIQTIQQTVPTCASNTHLDVNTGRCTTQYCPLGNYECNLINETAIDDTDTTAGMNDKTDNGQLDENGHCLGSLYIFNGNDNRCRPSGVQTGGTDCCKKGTTWFGLGDCKESEKALGKLREFGALDGNCHYIGEYCTEKWKGIGCVQKKKTYCCFSSPLSRIIQEGGREQLNIGWGQPNSPDCRGFTPQEFQKIDFSKINFSEWIQNEVIPNVQNNAVGNIQNVINNIDTNLAP